MMHNNSYRNLQVHVDTFQIGFPATESGMEIKLLTYLITEGKVQAAAKMNLVAKPVSKIIKRLS